MAKLSINLLQADLIAKQPLWTLKRVVGLWLVTLLVACIVWWMSDVQHQQSSTQFNELRVQQLALNERQTALEEQIKNSRLDVKLEQQLSSLTLLLNNKKSLFKQLTDSASTQSSGFSMAMTELAQLHHKDISLQQINIHQANMSFSGVARKPEAVPLWLAAFEQSTFLSGKSFNHLYLGENENKVMTFVVSSVDITTSQGE